MNSFGGLRGETFDQMSDRSRRQDEIGHSLAIARFERGQRLTDAESATLTHTSMHGCSSYPIAKAGRGWIIDHPTRTGGAIFKTKSEAWCAWEVHLAMLRALSTLTSHA